MLFFMASVSNDFYPRPPRGGRPVLELPLEPAVLISIHALREEGDTSPNPASLQICYFYPRPPRGGRPHDGSRVDYDKQFLSTPSARRATPVPHAAAGCCRYFYPRPPRGGRLPYISSFVRRFLISIHALREEGDRRGGGKQSMARKFLSTPSARRATAKTETKSLFSNKLYNILHEFRRALIYNGSKNYPNHAK